MSKTPTLADRYPDPCEACRPYGSGLSRTSCKNVHCSYNAGHYGTFAAPKPSQGPGKRTKKQRTVDRLRQQLRQNRAEAIHWDTARKTGRWSWPM